MSKRVSFSIVLLLLVIGVLLVVLSPEELPVLEPGGPPEPAAASSTREVLMTVGCGWSEEPSATQATSEALSKVRARVPKPDFLLIFFTSPYDPKLIRDTVVSQLGDVKVLGLQSANGVFTQDGLHCSPTGALAVMGFESDELRIGIGGGFADRDSDHRKVAEQVIGAAVADAGAPSGKRPKGIIAGQVMGFSEIYSSVLNERMPSCGMIGGNQITSEVTLGAIIANQHVYRSGFALALIYTDTRVGTYFHGGFSGRTRSGIVTKIHPQDDHVIVEIDNRPALEVYNEWSNGAFERYLGRDRPVIVNETVVKPLAKAMKLHKGGVHYLTLHPWKFNPDGSVNGGITVAVGDRLHYVEGDENVLVRRSGVVARRAMIAASIPLHRLAGGVHVYCIGAGMKLGIRPDGLATGIVREINANTSGAPFIGGFFGGEQGSVKGYGYFAGNLMSSMMVFSKEE